MTTGPNQRTRSLMQQRGFMPFAEAVRTYAVPRSTLGEWIQRRLVRAERKRSHLFVHVSSLLAAKGLGK